MKVHKTFSSFLYLPDSYQHQIVSNSNAFFSFLRSRKFIIQVLLSLVLLVALLFGTLRYLDYYTLHGQEITVPCLVPPKWELTILVHENGVPKAQVQPTDICG